MACLPPDIQRAARDSYAISLKAVFTLAACSTFLAYIVRLPVSLDGFNVGRSFSETLCVQIPEKTLEHKPRRKRSSGTDRSSVRTRNSVGISSSSGDLNGAGPSLTPSTSPATTQNFLESPEISSPSGSELDVDHAVPIPARSRRLSMFESVDGLMDLEGDRIGGSARQHSTLVRSL